jgi:hypothetical protein
VTLRFGDGFACSPAAACAFSCTGTGTELVCQNSGIADAEGGRYASTLAITRVSSQRATGAGTSSYTQAAQCQWVVQLALSRP